MTDLLWPGDERAGTLMSDAAVLEAMLRVEQAWLDALVAAQIAPRSTPLTGLVGLDDLEGLAHGAEAGGNPVIGLVRLLRERVPDDVAPWVHRGLTSQDVLDSALVLCARDALEATLGSARDQLSSLMRLADEHRDTVMAGRTLTQHAVPTTFGLKAAEWLRSVLDIACDLERERAGLPVQLGGAAGTRAALAELAHRAGGEPPERTVRQVTDAVARELGLHESGPWHSRRRPITRVGDALIAANDAWGHIANDVLTLSRPEIGELSEPAGGGRGGSSTMPHKVNPVLSVLIRRAALTAPGLGATLHLAAASADDDRPAGSWHAEWATVRDLARRTVVAAEHTALLVQGLTVHRERMRRTAETAESDLLAEARGLPGERSGLTLDTYRGTDTALIDAALAHATAWLEEKT